MELKNKIMKLYNEIHEPVKARKIVTLLKLVLVDGENDINKISEQTHMQLDTIKKYISDRQTMLKYLTEQEIEELFIKINSMLQQTNKKMNKLIKLVLIDGETDIDRLQELVPITLNTLRKYVNDKETLSKYLTKEELELFYDRINPVPQFLNRKLQKLIKLVLIDGETDINKIQKTIYITLETMKKYANDRNELLNYLKENEIDTFTKKVNDMIELEEKSVEIENLKIVRNIIDDIFHTRYKLTDICSKNFMQRNTFDEYLNKENYIDSNFGEGTLERVKAKISENGFVRTKVPRDCFIIDGRINIYIARDDLLYLNQFDNKRLNFAAAYLGSGANLEFVAKKYETNNIVALSVLFDKKLEQILKPEYYELLQKYIKIEKILLENNLEEKKNIMFAVINFLELNDFDKELAVAYFKLPEYLFNKVLLEALKMPYFKDEVKTQLKNIQNSEISNKVK